MNQFKKGKAEEQMDLAAEKIMERWAKKAKQQDEVEPVQVPEAPSEEDGLEQMPMTELWKTASSLKISKEGSKNELIERIREAQKIEVPIESNDKEVIIALDQLKKELSEYERIREGIKTRIESTSELILKLNERKELLEKDVNQKQQKIDEVIELLPKLEEEKSSLQRSFQEKQEQKMLLEKEIIGVREKIGEVNNLLPKLEKNKVDIQKSIKQNQEEILKVDEQVKQIENFQKYGLDLLSTLLYASKKSNK